ncbi:MAG TPA: hypothetical protein DCK93_01045, partial [Blastocatellia bacterium]|nr:hypothetical protein [Blastocatellia bacterium]
TVMKQGGIKKYAYASILKELKAAGYARRVEVRKPGGEFGYSLEIYEEPQLEESVESVQPLPNLPHTVEPLSDDPITDNRGAASNSTCARATNTPSTDKRELRERRTAHEKPRRRVKDEHDEKTLVPPADFSVTAEMRSRVHVARPDAANSDLDRATPVWYAFRRKKPRKAKDGLTRDGWDWDWIEWMSKPEMSNGNGSSNGRSKYESSADANTRRLRGCLDYIAELSPDSQQDSAEGSPRLLAGSAEPGRLHSDG